MKKLILLRYQLTTQAQDKMKPPGTGWTSSGYASPDGLYYYTVTADTGTASINISGEVSAITSVDGTQYLEIGDTGRLVSVSSITSVE